MATAICNVPECDSPSRSKGMCAPHYSRQWRAENAERKRAVDAAWREANRIKLRTDAVAYRRANPDRKLESDRRWRQANLESETKRRMDWDRANPEALKARMHSLYAMRKAAFKESVDLDELWLRNEGTCQLCRLPIDAALVFPDPMSRTLDHILPLSKGGWHEPANAQLAHFICNVRKGNAISA